MSGWFKKDTRSQVSHRSGARSRKSHARSRFVTLNSGLNKNEVLQLDPYIFYRHRQYLKEIEANGVKINGNKVRLPPNYFYEFVTKYIEAYKKLSKSDIPLEIRRDNVKKAREIVSYMDKTYANNALLNERPILSIMLHGSFMNSRDYKLNWHKDGTKEKVKFATSTPLKVDVIYISNPVLNDKTFFIRTSAEREEYDEIVLGLKYSSFLNKTLQKKQIDTVTQKLRDFYTKMLEARIKSYDKDIQDIKVEEEQIALFSRMKQKFLSLGKTMPDNLEESNNKRIKDLAFTKMHFEIHANLIKDFENAIHNKRNKFQVYYFKKGFKINKRLVKDASPIVEGIFDVNNKNYFNNYVQENRTSDDVIIQGHNITISIDKFINYYYDHLDIKPNNIIIIDNSCGGFEKNNTHVNKETENKMRKVFTNTQSRAKRSLNRSKLSLGKPHRSFSLNLNKPVKHIIPLDRSKPLTNQEITNIQQSERERQQKIMNEVEIQKELNKMVVKSPSRSRRSRSKTYPHEDVHEHLQSSLSKGSKSRISHGVEETKINE
jgi:hypothetical protein